MARSRMRSAAMPVRQAGVLWDLTSGQVLLDFSPGGFPELDGETLGAPTANVPAIPLAVSGAAAPSPLASSTDAPNVLSFRPRAVRSSADSETGSAAGAVASTGAARAEGWFTRGLELEASDGPAARDAYRQAVALDPTQHGAWINLGRLCHQAGDLASAEDAYRKALAAAPESAVAHFDLAVLLEDRGELLAAQASYQLCLDHDAAHLDAHYNLAGVCERLGDGPGAIRHLQAYRRLARGGS